VKHYQHEKPDDAFADFAFAPIPKIPVFAGTEELVSPGVDTFQSTLIPATSSQQFNNRDGRNSEEGRPNPNQKVITYQAHPTLQLFHRSTAFQRLIVGPIGSGSTTACIIELIRQAYLQEPASDGVRYTRSLIIRNSMPELKSTVVPSLEMWIDPELFPVRWTSPPRIDIRQALPDGTEIEHQILLLGLDVPSDVSKLLSLEISNCWLNEARHIDEEVYNVVQGRISRYPSTRMGGCTHPFLISDSNAPSKASYLYKIFGHRKPDDPDIALFQQPSALSPEAENLENLDPNYYTRLVVGKSQSYIKSYIEAKWVSVASGLSVYGDDFHDDAHLLEQEPEVPQNSKLLIGADWGLTPACVIFLPLASGHVIAIDELVTQRSGAINFLSALRELINERYRGCEFRIIGDPSGGQSSQVDERTVFDVAAGMGFNIEPAMSQDPIKRQESLRIMLKTLIQGKPWLRVSRKCEVFIAGLQGEYEYKRINASGEPRYSQSINKNRFSHVCEGAEYALMELRPQDYLGQIEKAREAGFDIDMGQLIRSPLDALLSPRGGVHPLQRRVFAHTRTMRNRRR